ncbi:MAG TPA: TetR/AcrR family transcriptional regulator C-terminal domain-containing protein [Patescibacteria group bacterium]|nr:TetR/AcrR family transcriptional regulator C-terminal domain-containing protein [Patescibacteria group bacterium]
MMTEPATPKVMGGREQGLEREMVVRAALKLLDEGGFGGLTLRKLAESLHVKASALYWHFENKQDLIDAMAEQIILAEFKHIEPASHDWRSILTMVARTNHHALSKYRDGAHILAHASLQQSSMLEDMEQLFLALEAQGFSNELAMAGFFSIIRYTLGCVFEEQADPRTRDKLATERAAHWKSMAGTFPAVSRALGSALTKEAAKADYMFERGLTIILDGIAYGLQGERLDAHPEGSLG